jgi:hypothetical protein
MRWRAWSLELRWNFGSRRRFQHPGTPAGAAALSQVAEADGNRTRQAGDARLNGFEEVQPLSA